MDRRSRCYGAVAALTVFAVGAVPDAANAHFPGVALTGLGTATIDGVIASGEWNQAGHVDFTATIPSAAGGRLVPGTLFVMNDRRNLYLAVRVA